MANLNLAVVIGAVDKLSAPLKKVTAATGRFRDQLGAAERAARNLSESKSDLSRRFTGATSGIAGQSREMRRWGAVSRGSLGLIGGLAQWVGPTLGGLAYTVKREIVDSAASFERFRTALETVEGSSGKARASMDWISSFAVKTPFELEQVTGAFVRLRSDGMDPTQGLLHTLGDASAATGKPLMQAVAAMAGAVSGDNEGLEEFGIQARAAEGGKIRYEYTVDGETKVAEAMAADGAQIQQVLSGILEVKFGGAMAEESKTFMGMLGNLTEQWTRFQNMVMASGLFDWLTGRLGRLLDTLDRMAASGELQQWAKRVGDGLMTAFQQAWEIGKQLWPVVTGTASAVGKAANAVGGFGNLLLILGGLGVAKKLWPMTEGIRGLGGEALEAAGGPRQLSKRLTTFTLAAGKAAGGAIKSFGASLATFAATGAAAAIAGLKGLIASTWTWTAALLANPITWVVAAVAAAAIVIYKYWEPISGFFIRLWDAIKAGAAAAWEWIKGVWSSAAAWFAGLWTSITEWFGSLSLAEMGASLVSAIGEGIRTAAERMLGPLKWVLDKAKAMLPESDARIGPLSKLTAAGGAIVGTMGAGVLRAGPGGLMRPLAQTLTHAAAGLALSLPAPAHTPAALPGFPSRAASPPGGASFPSQIDNSIHMQLTIHQQPGEDARELAERVLREIEHRRRVSSREALYDEL